MNSYEQWWEENKDDYQVGAKFRMRCPNWSRLYHVLAIVDEDRVVAKYWSQNNWHYEVLWAYGLAGWKGENLSLEVVG